MYYVNPITVAANTTESNAVVETLRMTRGIIRRVDIGFPSGCAGLVHVQLFHHETQIVPWTPGKDLAWDDLMFVLPHQYPMPEPPFLVRQKVWNLDDSYPHKIFVGVLMDEGDPEDDAMAFLKVLKEQSGLW